MPDQNGFELLKEIRALQSEAGGNVPVIAMTAFYRSLSRRRMIEAGFSELLSKPFGPNEILKAIFSVLPHSPT
jgi:CheY-like chemotaxis protein